MNAQQLDFFEMPTVKGKLSGQIDKLEFGLIRDKTGGKLGVVYGTYEEVETYCDMNDCWVDRYLDHVAPSTVRAGCTYIGQGVDPYELQIGFDYTNHSKKVDNSF